MTLRHWRVYLLCSSCWCAYCQAEALGERLRVPLARRRILGVTSADSKGYMPSGPLRQLIAVSDNTDFVPMDEDCYVMPYFTFLEAITGLPALLDAFHQIRLCRVLADDRLEILKEGIGEA
jgi:hypothetical protein